MRRGRRRQIVRSKRLRRTTRRGKRKPSYELEMARGETRDTYD